jgi:hypothetical protein
MGVKLAMAAMILWHAMAATPAWQAPVATAYLCPMHPDVVSRVPGTCPRCGMTLALADPFDARDFLVDVVTEPSAPRAGAPARLHLTVREPGSRAVVRDFAEVHEKRYHLFVIGQDLAHYDHIHPIQQPDGSFLIDVTLPRPGYYKVYSDFLPVGGTPQVVPGVLVTAGATRDLAAAAAHLIPDAGAPRVAGDMRISLALPPGGLVAGRDEKLHYTVVDARNGAPVTDLEPYLAAFGHTLVLSEDTLHYVHAHPVELLPDGGAQARGGPELTFKALLPRPGRYRVWTQLKRRGVVSTVAFTVDVKSPSSAAR